jgi:hypothetical protein
MKMKHALVMALLALPVHAASAAIVCFRAHTPVFRLQLREELGLERPHDSLLHRCLNLHPEEATG